MKFLVPDEQKKRENLEQRLFSLGTAIITFALPLGVLAVATEKNTIVLVLMVLCVLFGSLLSDLSLWLRYIRKTLEK